MLSPTVGPFLLLLPRGLSLILVTHHHVVLTHSVTTEYALVCPNTKAILMKHVDRNAFSVMNVQETKPVKEINAWILVQELAVKMLDATLLTTFLLAPAQTVTQEIRLYTAEFQNHHHLKPFLATLHHVGLTVNVVRSTIKQFALVCPVIKEVLQVADLNVLLVQNALKTELVSIRNVSIHVLDHAATGPDAKYVITVQSVAVLKAKPEIRSKAVG